MKILTTWAIRLAVAGFATGGIVVACRHEAEAQVPAAMPDGGTSSYSTAIDAATDSAVRLPPVPDANVLRDAGTPM